MEIVLPLAIPRESFKNNDTAPKPRPDDIACAKKNRLCGITLPVGFVEVGGTQSGGLWVFVFQHVA